MVCSSKLFKASLAGAVMLTGSMVYGEDLDLSFGGFVRGKIGSGDRYGKAQGEDTIGISKAALSATSSYENVDFSLLIGGRKMAHSETADTGEIDLEEAYVTINNVRDTAFSFSLGIQPLMLGLKPSGFAGDRSITGSVEYGVPKNGSAQVFAYSNQVEPSIIGVFDFSETSNLSFGIFDTDTSSASGTDGSSLFDNLFLQFRADEILLPNLYFVAGIEKRYVSSTNSSETGFDVGLGFRSDMFDLSYEYISLNKGYLGTASDESMNIIELTLFMFENMDLYIDYATASEMDLTTLRAGLLFNVSTALNFQLEYASDDAAVSSADADSIDLRVEYSF